MNIHQHRPAPVISVMLAVTDAPAAIAWYERALGATVLWSVGSVAGLEAADGTVTGVRLQSGEVGRVTMPIDNDE